MWRIEASDKEPEDLDSQIGELLGKLTGDLSVWKSIAAKYEVDLFCGLFMDKGNEGMSLSPKSLAALGARGIELGLDVYGPSCEPDEENA